MYVPPLKVHIGWFDNPGVDPRCGSIARSLYEYLHRPIADDPVLRPGLEIPVEIGRELGGLVDALEAGDAVEPPAGVRLVIAILDSAAYRSPHHRVVVDRMVKRWTGGPTRAARNEILLPILLHGGWGADLDLGAAQMLAGLVPTEDDGAPGWFGLCADIGVIAGRALLRRLHQDDPPRPHVFISHAKRDGAAIARELMAHFAQDTRIRPWFDATDVHRGEELGRQLQKATRDGVVLVVRTDRYAESPWCALELLAAKEARAPIVSLLATSDGEAAAPAYGGNHRTMNWDSSRKQEVTARCVQAWLHGHHFRAHAAAAIARADLPADTDTLPRKPELLDVMASSGPGLRLLVHPDPPPPQFEADLLRRARPSVRLATPNTLLGRVLLAQDPLPPLSRTRIAFSLSVPRELPTVTAPAVGSGLTQDLIDDVLHAIVLATLHSGATIAYGGDFRTQDGYARKLADFHTSHRRLATGSSAQLVCFLDQGTRDGIDERAVEYRPEAVVAPAGADAFPEVRSILWHLAMRDTMATTSHARILLGGKVEPSAVAGQHGYVGPWPGVLEEAARTVRARRALYVLGGFAGAGDAIARMLLSGAIPPAFTRAHTAPSLAALTSKVDAARGALLATGVDRAVLLAGDGDTLLGLDELAGTILDHWQRFCDGDAKAWPNGLSREENERLFRSTDRTEVTHLVFEGLRRIARAPTGALGIAVYHGDIASAPNVDGYAVTVTPGVPPVGGSAALARAGVPLPSVTSSSGPRVTRAPGGPDLPGRDVLVARLDAPPAGEELAPGSVQALAAEVARVADGRGIESIACTPFATTMGLTTAQSVHTMIDGIVAGRGSQPSRLVICERDRARYDEVKTALTAAGHTFDELRSGVVEARGVEGMVLYVDAVEPTATSPGQLRSTLFATDDRGPVVPRHDVRLSLDEWRELRGRLVSFAGAADRGRALWSRLFSKDIQRRLSRNREVRLAVLTTEIAAGLPWELLTDDGGHRHALGQGVVRRIALQGTVREPAARTGANALLRVLLVVNPTGDLPEATPEGNAVQTALNGRRDVAITRLDGAAATKKAVIDELATGSYDVLHFAGHAYYDTAERSRSGLYLADGTLTANDLPAATAPRLVFLSACESARVRDMVPLPTLPPPPDPAAAQPPPDDGAPLAEAFLRAGVSALVGTFVPVLDDGARIFATAAHAQLAAGKPLGAAVLHARSVLHGAERRDWGNFLLYGDDELVL